ncbi:hypothetical protein PVAND_013943 [Polypedilum vanderplanki]|uniref:Uncharacterized protein n=1 Tax=Polypedilum vanderplanki TaxID=319348 RepID=A0A9J6CR87_POLVA|nr:hypothetical protein PVAND_013943 [Polypedilum vanderplanki]
MNRYSWSIFAVLLLVCHMSLAAPNTRVKRDDSDLSLDPLKFDETSGNFVDREKRKSPEAAFQSKNAVLGFVFGKIDQFIDAKTRFVDQLDKTNIEKNKALGIEPPAPVPNFQALISGIITPKISAVSQKFAGLSSGVLGSSSGSSSGGSGGAGAGEDGEDGSGTGGGSAGGISSILSSVLRLSGPILSASLGGGSSGIASGNSDTTPDPDDDF